MSTVSEKATDALQQALDNCAKEPIHIPGAIQPHGYLLAVDENFNIVKCSANFLEFSGLSIEQIIGLSLYVFIQQECINELSKPLNNSDVRALRYRTLNITVDKTEIPCDVVLHQSGVYKIVEIEPHQTSNDSLQDQDFNLKLMNFSVQLHNLEDETDLFNSVIGQIKQLVGYGRVMLYRFDNDWNGEIIAESKDMHMRSYLGLNFPASDIPEQARKLYSINHLRLIADSDFTAVKILPDDLDDSGSSLDLSYSCLRSVSTIHLQYLNNMNVKSSMSVSVMQNGRLWGMIVCHHDTPYRPNYSVRIAAELFAHTFSAFLSNYTLLKSNSEAQQRAQNIRELSHTFSSDVSLTNTVSDNYQLILDLLKADGIVIKIKNNFEKYGETPVDSASQSLLAWISNNVNDTIFISSSLSDNTSLKAFENSRIAGAIVSPVDGSMENCIMFFRCKITTEKYWAGKPEKTIAPTSKGYQLTPRASFKRWVQEVSNQCQQWSSNDIEMSLAISGVLLSKQYEDSLKLASNNLDAIVNNSTSLIYIIDLSGLIVQINAKAREVFNLPARGLAGSHYREIFDASLSDITDEHIQTVQSSHQSVSFNDNFVQGDTDFHLITVVFPLHNTAQKVNAVCIISSDISDMHHAQTALKESNKELERVAFIASHDLQEPIRMISTFTKLLKTEYAGKLDETADQYIDYTLDATNRMRVLIQDLVEYSRLENEQINPPIIDSGDALQQVIDELEMTQSLENASLTIATKFPDVSMKQEHFKCMMQNLINNAIKYQKEGESAKIIIDCEDIGLHWRFSVADNGIGIKTEYLLKIFDIFQRLHNKNEYSGTGIGLAICTKIALIHGGKVWVESVPDKGSTFYFTILKTYKQENGTVRLDALETFS